MRTRTKLALFALFSIYCLATFAILSPLVATLTNNLLLGAVGFAFVFVFVLSAWFVSSLLPIEWKGIFSDLDDRETPKWWFRLHMLFTYTSSFLFMSIATVCTTVPLIVQIYSAAFPSVFMMTGVALLLSIIGLWKTHLIVGMGYKWFYKGTSLGI